MTEQEKALDWWNNLSNADKYNVCGIVIDHLMVYRLNNDQILECYNWVKSIQPKE